MNFPTIKVKTADLIPYANNSRTHSDAQVAQICASIKEFGFTNPIIKRWQEFTGKEAVHDDGRKFNEVANA